MGIAGGDSPDPPGSIRSKPLAACCYQAGAWLQIASRDLRWMSQSITHDTLKEICSGCGEWACLVRIGIRAVDPTQPFQAIVPSPQPCERGRFTGRRVLLQSTPSAICPVYLRRATAHESRCASPRHPHAQQALCRIEEPSHQVRITYS
jgi:hypothetical protein